MDQGYLRVENTTDFAWVGDGIGDQLAEKFIGCVLHHLQLWPSSTSFGHVSYKLRPLPLASCCRYDPADPGGTVNIMAGSPVILISVKTGLFCRLAVYTGNRLAGAAAQVTRGLLQTTTTVSKRCCAVNLLHLQYLCSCVSLHASNRST
jgi:hypothetical protein